MYLPAPPHCTKVCKQCCGVATFSAAPTPEVECPGADYAPANWVGYDSGFNLSLEKVPVTIKKCLQFFGFLIIKPTEKSAPHDWTTNNEKFR